MAVNNFLAAEQPPQWARRGYFREAGFYEGPAEMAKSILSGRWDFSPAALFKRVPAYSDNHLLDWAKENHVTMLRLVWSPGFSHQGDQVQWDIMRDLIARAHRKRIRIIAYLSVTNSFWQEMFEAEPDAKNWKQLDHSSQDVPYMAATYTGIVTRVLMCVNRRPWRDYIKYKIAKALEAGADGLFFDNLFSKCYCPECRRAFADYTQSLFGQRQDMPPPDVAHGPRDQSTRTGVEVVADSERHKSETRSALSLARDQFWNNSVADYMQELWQHARSLKPDVLFYPNAHERWPINLHGNFKLSEDQQPCRWTEGGAMWTNVALWKYFYEDAGREKPAVNGADNKLMWAEILAFGCDPIREVDPLWNTWHAKFGRQIYANTQPAGRVGLLMRSLSPMAEKSPAVTLLARGNVQFDIIVYEMMLQRYDLSRYELLLANDVRFLSDEACRRIRDFVTAGGTLIASGQTSLFTDKWESRSDYALRDLFGVSYQPGATGRFEQTVGRGRVIFRPQSIQDAAHQQTDPQLLQQWLTDVAGAQKNPALQVDGPDGLLASVWLRTRPDGQAPRGSQRIVHLVNYRPEPVPNVTVLVPGIKSAKIQLLSPEADADLTPQNVEQTSAGLRFTVPAVGVYTVAMIG